MEAQALERDEQAGAGVSNVEAPAPGFAKRKNRGHIRKRPADEADGAAAPAADGELADGAAPAVARRSKAAKEAPLAFTTRREGGGDAGAGPRLEAFKYESARTLQQASDMGATRGNQQETAFDRDARRALPSRHLLCVGRLCHRGSLLRRGWALSRLRQGLAPATGRCPGPGRARPSKQAAKEFGAAAEPGHGCPSK